MTSHRIAYEGTRDICSRIGCKIENAVDEFYLNGKTNTTFGIVDDETAKRMEFMSIKMETVATTGVVFDDDWEAVNFALAKNKELAVTGPGQ